MALLKVLQGSCPGQLLELHGDRMVIGRHPNCRIVLDNAAVSRHHAQILESHGHFFLEDLRSRNGTSINGKLIEGRTSLSEGDEIGVCDFLFSFHFSMPPEPQPDRTQGRSAGSAKNVPPPTNVELERDSNWGFELGENSSVISTMNVASMKDFRLAIKPEAKLRAILEITSLLSRTLELEKLLPKILDGLFRLFPQADRGFLMLKNADGQLVMKALHVRDEEQRRAARVSTTIVNRTLKSLEAILSEDAADDSRFSTSDSIANLQIRSMMCVPLVGTDETALGVLQVDTQTHQYRFARDDLDLLASVASQIALAVENAHLHEELLVRRDLERDLDFATQVQLGFLPTERPKLAGYDFYDFYEAAHRVGGDFFDYVTLPDGRVAVAIGDVAGKGIPAALLMARLYSMVRYHLVAEPTPARSLSALNASIASSGLGHRFITFLIAVIDPATHIVTLVNAGHLPPVLQSKRGKVTTMPHDRSGLPVGVTLDFEYDQTTIPLKPGDNLFLFTDGVTEAMNPRNEIYSNERISRFLAKNQGTLESLGEGLVEDVEKFCEGSPQRDDICLVCFGRNP